MPSCFSSVAPVRKEVRSLRVCAPAHIVNGRIGNAEISKLKTNQCGEVTMRLQPAALNDCATAGSLLHLTGHFLADLERVDPDVRTYRNEELGWIVRERVDGSRNDARYGAAPAGVRCADVPARRVRDQDGHAIGGARSDPSAFNARDEGIALQVGDGLGNVRICNLPHLGPMHLPLLEETIAGNAEGLRKARSVLANRVVVVTKMKAQVERVVRREAHATRAGCKHMVEAMPLQEGRLPCAHTGLCSMAALR